jgi:hypothetical protein
MRVPLLLAALSAIVGVVIVTLLLRQQPAGDAPASIGALGESSDAPSAPALRVRSARSATPHDSTNAQRSSAEAEAEVGDVSDAGLSHQERMDRAVQREYDRWYDAGLGPHQVEVRIRPDGLIETRVSAVDLYEPPVDLDALTSWELQERDPAAGDAVGAVTTRATELTTPCLNAFLRRLRAEGRKLTEDLDWRYVWRVRSQGGHVRVIEIEVREEWWPALFGASDRACFDAAFAEIERREYFTDVHDFDYRIETGAYVATEREKTP